MVTAHALTSGSGLLQWNQMPGLLLASFLEIHLKRMI